MNSTIKLKERQRGINRRASLLIISLENFNISLKKPNNVGVRYVILMMFLLF